MAGRSRSARCRSAAATYAFDNFLSIHADPTFGLRYYGTVRRMRAYSRPRQVVCLFPPSDVLPAWLGNRTVLAAGSTARHASPIP